MTMANSQSDEAEPLLVEVTIYIPVEAFNDMNKNHEEWMEANFALECATESMAPYHQISVAIDKAVGHDKALYSIWVCSEWEVRQIWDELERAHGVSRDGRVLCLRGKLACGEETLSNVCRRTFNS